MVRLFAVAALAAAVVLPPGQAASAAPADAESILRASRAALGIDALPKIRTLTLHGAAKIVGYAGTADSYQDLRTGAFAQYAETGPVGGANGYDGRTTWNEDVSGVVWDDASAQARYASIDAVYLGRYLLWSPDRGGAAVSFTGRRSQAGRTFDVLRVTPKGGLPFELWLDATTFLPARSIVTIGRSTTVSTYADYRSVRGLRVPFTLTTDSDGNAATIAVRTAVANDPRAVAMLRRPSSHVTDFALPAGTTSIPIELIDNHVALNVTINGKGPYRFLFDTGGSNVLDIGIAKELGLGIGGTASGGGVGSATEAVQFATVDALGVGDATLRKQVFALAPVHAGFGMSSGKPVDGLIGFEVLARFITTFDYTNNRVVLRTPQAPAPPAAAGARTIPFVFQGQHPEIPCTIGGFPTTCVVDTGSRVSLTVLTPFLAAHPSIVPPNVTAVGANGFGFGGASLGKLGRTTLQIGGFTVPDIIADLSTQTKGAFADPYYGGNIGAGVWKRFAITLDYTQRTLTLAPNAQLTVRETYDRSGVFLINQAGKIVVADVRPGTPAAAAGLARGDVITTVDGKDAAGLGVGAIRDTFRGAPGTAVVLGVTSKNAAARTLTLTLNDYV
ncbi:MAG TPA: aspartyl protease family protein [Kofleriaceae bacterium]